MNKLITSFQIKSLDDQGIFTGYASVYGNIDRQNEIVAKNAFKTIRERIPILYQHNKKEPIGKVLSFKDDAYGLFIEAKLTLDSPKAKESYALLKDDVLGGMSIGYKVKDYHVDPLSKATILDELELFEISLVTFPANESAIITSVKEQLPTIREFESYLRDEGFSTSQAKIIIARGYKSLFSNSTADEESAKKLLEKLYSLKTKLEN